MTDDNYGSAPTARTYAGWAEAFTIFAKYSGDDHVAAEHDEIYAGPNPEVVSPEDKLRLEALCWRECSRHECFARFT